ncbi:hypothetical protein [Amphiplicatus metriothermophilus]|uniref:Lipoprotein n=1 Tax=Amphiplicatus metriothermophilus TaxID=1519374 RepID=A0A239PQ46_9PROT|nr:hypothetical protein [Amphiplicatus metriothermophilus]MBB5518581.1 hypothetical protein [Amphiplicatus metriothermophilus]SNT72260.1 hypothetical protein SAMN06297382_1298 [Amphiplicatus metriothermophilus]
MKFVALSALVAGALALAACETTSTRPYQPSVQNVLAMKAARDAAEQKLKINTASAAEGVETSLTCRALGALEVAPGQTPVEYIHGALQTELFQAELYDQIAGTPVDLKVTQLDFNSFGTGKWTVAITLSSPNLPEGYSTSVDYTFKTSWSALKACQNVIDAFQPTVSALIRKAVEDPNFQRL